MNLAEMLPDLRALPTAEKLRLMQMLAADLADSADSMDVQRLIEAAAHRPVWSPFDAFEAAEVLSKFVEESEAK